MNNLRSKFQVTEFSTLFFLNKYESCHIKSYVHILDIYYEGGIYSEK